MRLIPLLALALFAACTPRVPPTRGEITGVADGWLQGQGRAWGDPIEVLAPPDLRDPDQRRWWQLRYAPAAGEAPRILLVDDESLWVRRPPAGWRVRLPARPGDARSATGQVASLRTDPGSWVAMLGQPQALDDAALTAAERRVIDLNTAAGPAGLLPLFRLHQGRDGARVILYGWQADGGGIARDERLMAWLTAFAADAGRTWHWVDLNPTP